MGFYTVSHFIYKFLDFLSFAKFKKLFMMI